MPFLLDFAGVGPPRTGTTNLDETLRHHPALALPHKVKETFFIDRHFDRGWDWYAAHFPGNSNTLRGELASTWFDHPEAPARLHAHNPRLRILISLRHPLDRLLSHHRHLLRRGEAPGDLARALDSSAHLRESGRYARHVPRWQQAFGGAQVRGFLLDDLRDHPQSALDNILAYIGVASMPVPASTSRNVYASYLPRHPRLATAFARTADYFRRRQWHTPVNLAKQLGLERLAGHGPSSAPPDPALLQDLLRQSLPDVEFVEHWLGRPLPAWRHWPPPPSAPAP